MPDFRVWDIVRVPFPHTDRPIRQRRPALIVGQHRHPGSPHLLWLLTITSATHRSWSGDVEIPQLAGTGLPSPSIVRCAKIATVETSGVEPIGSLGVAERQAVRAVLAGTLRALLSEPIAG